MSKIPHPLHQKWYETEQTSSEKLLIHSSCKILVCNPACVPVCLSRVHVRRTDKVGTEAAFHPIEEYMLHVEEQFQHLARRVHVDKKRVYLATDDPSLLQEAKTKSVSRSVCVCVVCECVNESNHSHFYLLLSCEFISLWLLPFCPLQVSRLWVHQW